MRVRRNAILLRARSELSICLSHLPCALDHSQKKRTSLATLSRPRVVYNVLQANRQKQVENE